VKTEIKRVGDTVIVSIGGRLDFETAGPLRESLGKLVNQVRTDSAPRKIIVNCEELEFVGSSGISAFVQTLKEFNSNAPIRPRYANVKSEFKRVIKAFDDEAIFDFHDNVERARRSFDN
jgi:anti-anti-sigma factor